MSKIKLSLLTTFLFTSISGLAFAQDAAVVDVTGTVPAADVLATVEGCELPTAPIIPDGNVASQDELLAAQKAMKAYQGVLVDYRLCIDEKNTLLDLETEEGAATKLVHNSVYDASVTAEENVAEQFNLAVRAFKARGN